MIAAIILLFNPMEEELHQNLVPVKPLTSAAREEVLRAYCMYYYMELTCFGIPPIASLRRRCFPLLAAKDLFG